MKKNIIYCYREKTTFLATNALFFGNFVLIGIRKPNRQFFSYLLHEYYLCLYRDVRLQKLQLTLFSSEFLSAESAPTKDWEDHQF